MKQHRKKHTYTKKELNIYNYLSFIFGISSIVLTLTGIIGIILGLLGMVLSVIYFNETRKIRFGYILSVIGTILSSIFFVLQISLIYGINMH